jgi:hypothetical protein
VAKLVEHGFLPIVTAARTWPEEAEPRIVENFAEMLRSAGYRRPRLKILPTLRIGAEAARTRAYTPSERVTAAMLQDYDVSQLVCEHSRMVTDRGVYVCPILIESAAARMGDTLADAMQAFPIDHGACYTCYEHGAICANPSAGSNSAARNPKSEANPTHDPENAE